MNRQLYFNYIEENLNYLALRVESRVKVNILDLNLHSEGFYCALINLLYGYNVSNMNATKQNIEGIDLKDDINKIIVQVSSTATKQKIESSLEKDIMKLHSDYNFKFISISKNASSLRVNKFRNPHQVLFSPADDIIDINSILSYITNLQDIDKIKDIYTFIKKELGKEPDIKKLPSNLASIINILSKENLDGTSDLNTINEFEVERKIDFNKLDQANYVINEYFCYNNKISEIYEEFDKVGSNKSLSVFGILRKEFSLLTNIDNNDEIFFALIERIKEIIMNSENYIEIPIDELELCVDILIVDAFVRCKIFKNPKGYNYVNSR